MVFCGFNTKLPKPPQQMSRGLEEFLLPTLPSSLHYLGSRLKKMWAYDNFILNSKAEKMIYGDSKLAETFGVASANFDGVIKPLSHFMASYYAL